MSPEPRKDNGHHSQLPLFAKTARHSEGKLPEPTVPGRQSQYDCPQLEITTKKGVHTAEVVPEKAGQLVVVGLGELGGQPTPKSHIFRNQRGA